MPGMILGILIEPNIEIMATKIAISQSVEDFISHIVNLSIILVNILKKDKIFVK